MGEFTIKSSPVLSLLFGLFSWAIGGCLSVASAQESIILRFDESKRGPQGLPASLEATGTGLEPSNAESPEQARLLAKRAATVVAYHDLIVSRNRLNSYFGEPLPPQPDGDGFIQGARVIETKYLTQGKVLVTVELPIILKVIPRREKWLKREAPRSSDQPVTEGGPVEITRQEWLELIKSRREKTKAEKEESETAKNTSK